MKIKDGFVLEEVGENYIAVAVSGEARGFNGVVRLNSTGAFLWNLMKDEDVSREELLEKLLEAYDVPRERALDDIIKFENTLRCGGIIA